MIIRRSLIALTVIACAAVVAISIAGSATADGPARFRKARAHRRQPHAATAITPSIGVIDQAGVKRLIERGAPPQDRPLLLNFWATWCDPCREEFPDLVKIDADYRSRGLDFVAISLDELSDMKTSVPRFLRSQRATMPVYLLDVPDQGAVIELVDPTWQGNLPATFLYDQSGKVVYKHMGPVKAAELRGELDKLMIGSKQAQ